MTASSSIPRIPTRLRSLAVFLAVGCLVGCSREAVEEVPDDPARVMPVLIGETAPGFELRDARGRSWRLDPENVSTPVVLVFYRGGWCPFCSAHLMDLREAEQEVIEMGYEFVFVSPDRQERLAESLELLDAEYTLLSDSDLVVARKYGVAFRVDDETVARYLGLGIDLEDAAGRTHHWLPVPSVFIIGTDGLIRFEYVNPNYKVRISADLLRAAARTALEYAPITPLRR